MNLVAKATVTDLLVLQIEARERGVPFPGVVRKRVAERRRPRSHSVPAVMFFAYCAQQWAVGTTFQGYDKRIRVNDALAVHAVMDHIRAAWSIIQRHWMVQI